MLDLCNKHSVPVILDSDAHDPSAVGDLSLAEKLIEEYCFPKSLES